MAINDTMAMVTASTSNGRSTVLCVCIYCVYSSLIMRVIDRWLPGLFIYLSCGLSEILACLLSVIWLSVIRGRVFDSMSFVRVTSATGAARPNYWASVRLSLLFWNVEGTIVSQLLLTWGKSWLNWTHLNRKLFHEKLSDEKTSWMWLGGVVTLGREPPQKNDFFRTLS